MAENIQNNLKKIALFTDLPDDMIAQLAGEVKERTYSAGEVLFNEGEEGDSLYFIQSGEVEIYQPSDGKIFELLKEGDYFGEMALLETEPRSASARTRVQASLLRLEQAAFTTLLEKNPQLGLKMTHRISARLRMSMASSHPGSGEAKAAEKKESTTKVFISYSRRDKPFVLKLNEAVSTHGIDTWVDWENIPLTADWWNEIRLGIENADAFAFIISPDSLTSEVCDREVQTAVDNHKRLIPILHREPEKGNPMHEKISSHNWIYMRDDAEIAANVPQMLETINTDLDFVRAHTRLLERALGWEREKKNNSFVLQGDELHNAERWLESAGKKQPQPTPLHIEFIQASRRAASQRQRMIMTASLVGLAIAVVLAIVSFVFYLQANDAKDDAVTQQAVAEAQKATAEALKIVADNEKDVASTAQVEAIHQANLAATAQAEAEIERDASDEARQAAVTAQAEAETQKALAEDKALLAKAGDLAASGLTLLESNPPLAVLLALESERLSPNNQTAQEVLSLLPIYFPPLTDTFIDPAQSIGVIAWSPDGQLASSSGADIILWDLVTHEPNKIITGTQDYITAITWNSDGRLATGASDGSVVVWNVETDKPDPVPVVPPPNISQEIIDTGITGVSWSPRGYFTYSYGDAEGTIVVQDLTGALAPIPTILKNGRTVNAIAWGPLPAPELAAGLESGIVALWTVNMGNQTGTRRNLDGHEAGVISVAFAPDGSLASGSRDSTVMVKYPNSSRLTILRGHADYVNVVAWSDDNRLASASWDKTVILWDLENEVPQRVLRGHSSSVGGLDWGPEGKLTSGADFIYIWNTNADYALTTYAGHLDWVNSVLWTPQGQLVSGGGDGKVIFWDEETQKIGESISDIYPYQLAVSSNNRILSSGILLDHQTGQSYTLGGFGQVFSPDGNFVAGIPYGPGNELAIWSLAPLVETRQVVSTTSTIEGEVAIQVVAWSPDGNTIATGQSDGTITLWDFNIANGTATLRTTLPGHEGGVNVLAWSPDGHLASAGGDKTIIVWDVVTLKQDKVLASINAQPISAMTWSPHGELASISMDEATGIADENIVVWDVEQGVKKAILGAPYRGPITTVAWSPDGTKLAFGGQSYNVYVYSATYVQPPCTWLSRNLTYPEWSTYLPGEPYQPTCPDLPVGTAFEDEKAALLDEASQAIFDGDIAFGVAQFEEAEAQGMEIESWRWGGLCWFGALYNQAEISNFACDRAIELEPENGDFRDSRGISRALLGDFEGAIEDFEAFVAYAQETGFYEEEYVALREAWLEALREGINPFDEATLASLRGE